MANELPPVPSLKTIQTRLQHIFPEGSENRRYVTREMAAKTIFVMFYTGAVEGSDRWIRPDQVTKMSDSQARKLDNRSREHWITDSLAPGRMKNIPGRWYAANTREPIRDETLRMGLVFTGAVIERQGLPTTSSKPRYTLNKDFASLFEEQFSKKEFYAESEKWQETYLSPSALARIRLRSRGAMASKQESIVLVRLPNGESRQMEPGPSSVLSKAVIEVFTTRFMSEPAAIFLSTSGNKVISEDYELASSLGLKIRPDRNLPDIILADIAPRNPLIVFVEVVVTDGAITRARKESLLRIAVEAGFPVDQIVFVSAFQDRGLPVFGRLSSEIAWGTYAWFSTEPDYIIHFSEGEFGREVVSSLKQRPLKE